MDVIVSAIAFRTGSTLVQRLFNARPATLIWGEHGGIVSEFVKIGVLAKHFSVHGKAEREAYFASGENPNTWIANMSPDERAVDEAVVAALRACLKTLYDDRGMKHDRIGFKEVRYGKAEIELLKACFPNAVVVLLVRHPADVWKSETSYWSDDARRFGETWNARALEYASLCDPARGIHLVRYEDIAGREKRTLRLLSELADVPVAALESVLGVNLNSTRAERSGKDIAVIAETCREGMRLFGYASDEINPLPRG